MRIIHISIETTAPDPEDDSEEDLNLLAARVEIVARLVLDDPSAVVSEIYENEDECP